MHLKFYGGAFWLFKYVQVKIELENRDQARSQDFAWRMHTSRTVTKKINVGMIGLARLLGGRGMLSRKNFEILDPQTAGNAVKLSILPSPRYFVSF